MDDTPEKIRRHYLRQSLPAGTAEHILALGRQASQKRFRRRLLSWSVAAMFSLVALGFVYRNYAASRQLEAREIEGAMEIFFSRPDYQVARVSSNLPELQSWLKQRGAPANAVVSGNFLNLPIYGCHVLQVRSQSVYLLCFFLDPANPTSGPMMKEKTMVTVQNPDGTMMKKKQTLVHFVETPLSAFKNPPQTGAPVKLSVRGDWTFAEWRAGDVVYIAGGALPEDRLRQLVAKR